MSEKRYWFNNLGIHFSSESDLIVNIEEIKNENPVNYCWPSVFETMKAEEFFKSELKRHVLRVQSGEESMDLAIRLAIHSVWAAGRLYERKENHNRLGISIK